MDYLNEYVLNVIGQYEGNTGISPDIVYQSIIDKLYFYINSFTNGVFKCSDGKEWEREEMEEMVSCLIEYIISINPMLMFMSMENFARIYSAVSESIGTDVYDISYEQYIDNEYKKHEIDPLKMPKVYLLDEAIQLGIIKEKPMGELKECPICYGDEIEKYYMCSKCDYKFCENCYKELLSRKAACPCCSADDVAFIYVDNKDIHKKDSDEEKKE